MPTQDSPTCLQFSSDKWPRPFRIEIWREQLRYKLFAAAVDPLQSDTIDIAAKVRTLPLVRFGAGSVGRSIYRRGGRMIADDNDDLVFLLNFSGAAIVSQNGRDLELKPGQAAVLSCADSSMLTRWRAGKMALLRIPRRELLPLAPDIENLFAQPLNSGKHVLRLLNLYTTTLYDAQPDETPQFHRLIESHIRDLLALTAGTSLRGDHMNGGLGAAKLAAIKADVHKRLGRGDLRASQVAARHGVSERQMQRLFEQAGTTFQAFLQEQRLLRAYRLLIGIDRSAAPIGEIAYECGFGDLSHFNRVFRRRFHATPSDVRQQSRHPSVLRD